MGVGKKRVRLIPRLDIPIMMTSILTAFSLHLLFAIQPELSPRQSPSCLRERSVFTVDKDKYTWVPYIYINDCLIYDCEYEFMGIAVQEQSLMEQHRD